MANFPSSPSPASSVSVASPPIQIRHRPWPHRAVAALLVTTFLLTFVYSGISLLGGILLAYVPPVPIRSTPAALGLDYRDVSFVSRGDHVRLRGWFIPGVLPNGRLSAQRTIIMIHGTRQNRTDTGIGLLQLSGEMARHGFAVLAFDMRGMGESAPAPLSLGYYEQHDVLGAVDFLRSGPPPYPELGRPRAIGGWGGSLGAASLLLAAALEPAIQAIVSDSAFADVTPLLEREVPKMSRLPAAFTPGILLAARALYDIDYYADRPVDVVAKIAPRPIFFIHGSADHYIPPSNEDVLVQAAKAGRDAHVTWWRVLGADHVQGYHKAGAAYIARVVAFFTDTLGSDGGA
ncbi:MAG: alpha/beta hydrolase [Ktedonobacterales bacterium]